jgi:hypothetical protein
LAQTGETGRSATKRAEHGPDPTGAPTVESPQSQVSRRSRCPPWTSWAPAALAGVRATVLGPGRRVCCAEAGSDARRCVVQAIMSAAPAGGPDDALPSAEMAGLEVKDGAPRPVRDGSDEEDEAAGEDGQQGRYALLRSMPCGPGGILPAQCSACHSTSTL